MRIALVHDYLREFGGAERVLKVLTEMYPEAPIYTAFSVIDSTAQKEFKNLRVFESFLAPLLKIGKLYSPLRFLIPWIWGGFDLSKYDLVIASSGWYVTRGFKVGPKTKVIVYCHTPPRWLYGFETSVEFTKYWPVKLYSKIVGYFMRKYDFRVAQPIKYWVANSKNVAERVKKYYSKDAIVIYPPVDVAKINAASRQPSAVSREQKYFLVVSRLVGAKGIEAVVETFSDPSMSGYKLKIVGGAHGMSAVSRRLSATRNANIEILGRVSDGQLYKLYAGAVALICLAKEEDFGMTPVEAMAAGTPVIAYNGGGYKESVIDGKTGVLMDKIDKKTLIYTIKHFNELIHWKGLDEASQKQAERFSKERFIREFKNFVLKIMP